MRLKYSFMSIKEQKQIHESTLSLLNSTGVMVHSEKAHDIFKHHGARSDGKKIFIPEHLIEDALMSVPHSFTLDNGRRRVSIGKGPTCFMPPYGATYVRKNRQKTAATVIDFENFSKLSHMNNLINMSNPYIVEPGDIPINSRERYKMAMSLSYSDKPGFSITQNGQTAIDSIHFSRDFFSLSDQYHSLGNVNISSPLIIGKNTGDVIVAHAHENQPLMIACGSGLSGLTAPPTLASNFLLNNAAVISGITLSQLVTPGLPVIFGFPLFGTDPIHANVSCGHPSTGLFTMAAADMGRFYQLPVRSGGVFTDSEALNYRSGFESSLNLFSCLFSDVDCIMHTMGMEESLQTLNYHKFIMDEILYESLSTYLKGFEINDVSLMLDEIENSGCEGNYISMTNLKLIRKFYKLWPFPDDEDALLSQTQKIIDERLAQYRYPDYDRDQLKLLDTYFPELKFLRGEKC
ncbi:MAG: trimethylamine---corrinoid protein Co-methyltransferase [Eubacteriaceae bacterium]|jgi:trimethylamine--corrinoid protein Co-methyltransferase|nr:trimethylamine---corrinoid protein Co-methyltransferase [Eubacteriaceae bacterium]